MRLRYELRMVRKDEGFGRREIPLKTFLTKEAAIADALYRHGLFANQEYIVVRILEEVVIAYGEDDQ